MKLLDIFSGIGGFSLGLERAGMETVAFCEIEEFPRRVLKKHWPDIPIYEDVRELTSERLRSDGITRIEVISGGFPCQDISLAGNQAGIGEGTRSGLWSECARLLGDIRPKYAIFENVTALLSGNNGRWFEQVLWDISKVGYDAEWHCIPATYVGAPHQRDRVWIICNSNSNESGFVEYKQRPDWPSEGMEKTYSNSYGERIEREWRKSLLGVGSFSWWEGVRGIEELRNRPDIPEPTVRRINDGVSFGVDRLNAIGNAVVPQIPELIGRAIMEYESDQSA